MKKNLRFLFILSFVIICFQNKTIAQCWNNGDLTTYDQLGWDQAPGSTTLTNNFSSVYGGGSVIIGSTYQLAFSNASAILSYLPSNTGPFGPLTHSLQDPTATESGIFGGDILSLQLDVDFGDANVLTGNSNSKFGDLVLYGFTSTSYTTYYTDLTSLNGLTVRQFLAIGNAILGNASSNGFSPVNIIDLELVFRDLTGAFQGGTPSTFAQQHLKKGWKSGDFLCYNQNNWGSGGSGNALLVSEYGTVYASTAGGFQIGGYGGHTALWTDVSILSLYVPATGGAATLTSNVTDATSTSSGVFGGDVAALKLNIDFSDAGFVSGNSGLKFGDLVLYGFTDFTSLNGTTVRQFLQTANTVLGGNSSSFSAIDADQITIQLNTAFYSGTPSTWAQLHLKRGWQNGDLTSYPQAYWGSGGLANTILNDNYVAVYSPNNYIFQIGSPSGFTAQWTDNTILSSYLPSNGIADALNANVADVTFTSSGIFGGQVAALKLNVDFADANILSANSGLKFGDLTICGLTSNTALNGKTVRQLLDVANIALSGASSPYSISDLNVILSDLDPAFNGGIPNQWSQLHLVNGSCDCGNTVTNHCPTAASVSVSTTVGTQVKFILQGSDADNNTLTYTISQSPTHGTAVIAGGDSILYTPAAGYHGTDQIKYKVSDGQCEAEGTVNITVIVCPGGQGYWKNTQSAWPVSSLMLGANSYTKSQLITILNTPVGTGNNADASLILAYQLIAAKLSLANGSPDPGHLADSIATADALIGTSLIPMKVKANSPLGKKMISLATYLSTYNSGSLTTGCSLTSPITMRSETEAQELSHDFALFQNHPNPFNTETIISYQLPFTTHVQLNIYNTVGQEVMKLVDEVETEGTKTVQVNASGLSKGIYYYRLTAGTFSQVRKMMVVR